MDCRYKKQDIGKKLQCNWLWWNYCNNQEIIESGVLHLRIFKGYEGVCIYSGQG